MPTFRRCIPDLIEIQRQSFFYFLEKGIIEEFSKRNPITNVKKDVEIFFYPEYYRLTKPKYSIEKCILMHRTYCSKLYVPVQLTDRRRKRIFLKWILIAELPLMTKRGHFICNGSARVIVNQLVRSPGVYFQEVFSGVYKTKWDEKPEGFLKLYFADLICLRGTWLRLEIDKEKKVWIRMKRHPKVPVLWFLLGLGLSEKQVFGGIEYPNLLLENFKPKENEKQYLYVHNPTEAWKQIYLELVPKKEGVSTFSMSELGRRWFFKRFMNPRNYDLGKHGRTALNQKLGLSISLDQTTLTGQDLLSITNILLKLEQGIGFPDDIDHLKNRRIRTSGDLIQAQFSIGLIRLEQMIREKLAVLKEVRLNDLISARAVNGALKEFFGTNPLSQFMDQMNPLAEITHKRRLSSMGPGGVTRDNATLAIRGIHPSHYGRICPIETPEGKNTGLVNSLTTFCRVNSQGLLETAFFKIYNGQIQKQAGLIYLTADQEEKVKVAASDTFASSSGFLSNGNISARIGTSFKTIVRDDVEFVGVSPFQMISVATSLIPFLEHDDANRALMGSNMQRQAVPLVRPERPLVGTGLEARAVSDSGHALTAKYPGFVTYSSGNKIVVYTFKKAPQI